MLMKYVCDIRTYNVLCWTGVEAGTGPVDLLEDEAVVAHDNARPDVLLQGQALQKKMSGFLDA